MKQLISAAGRLVRQFPRTHLLLSMVLLGGVILIAFRPDSTETAPERVQAISLPERTAPAPKPQTTSKPAPATPQWQTLTVQSGDSLSSLLHPLGIGAGQIDALLKGDDKLKRLTRLRPGEALEVIVSDSGSLTNVRYHPSKVETLTARLTGGGWNVRLSQREYQKQTRFAQAVPGRGRSWHHRPAHHAAGQPVCLGCGFCPRHSQR